MTTPPGEGPSRGLVEARPGDPIVAPPSPEGFFSPMNLSGPLSERQMGILRDKLGDSGLTPEDPDTLEIVRNIFSKAHSKNADGAPVALNETEEALMLHLGGESFFDESTSQKLPADADEEMPDWLKSIDSAAGDDLGSPSNPYFNRPQNRRRDLAVQTLVERRSTPGWMEGVYRRADDILKILGKRVESIKAKTRTPTETLPVEIDVQLLADPEYTEVSLLRQRLNCESVKGTKDARGYLDEMVVQSEQELSVLEAQRSELDDSKRRNAGAITPGVKREIVVQGETAILLVNKADLTPQEKAEWVNAANARIATDNAKIPVWSRDKKKPPVTEADLPASLNVARPKKIEVIETQFDPERAQPVIDAKNKLDAAENIRKEAHKQFTEYSSNSLITKNAENYDALISLMDELGVSSLNTTEANDAIIANLPDDKRNKLLRLGATLKPSASDLKDKKVDLKSEIGVLRYLRAKLDGDEALREYEFLHRQLIASVTNVADTTIAYKDSQTEAKRWRVDAQGRPQGEGHKELAETERQIDIITVTLGDTAIVDLYLQNDYLPNPSQLESVESAQGEIKTIEGEILQITEEIADLTRRKEGIKFPKILASIEEQINERREEIRVREEIKQDALKSIFDIMDPSARLKRAAEEIEGMSQTKVSDKLKLLGLSADNVPDQLRRVGEAFNQVLNELPKGKVPTELELFGMVVAKLRGEQPPEIVEGPPASEPPPQVVRPVAPPVPGAPRPAEPVAPRQNAPLATGEERQAAEAQRRTAAQQLSRDLAQSGTQLTVEEIMALDGQLSTAVVRQIQELVHREKSTIEGLHKERRKAIGNELLAMIEAVSEFDDPEIRAQIYIKSKTPDHTRIIIEGMLKLGFKGKDIINYAKELTGKRNIMQALAGIATLLPFLLKFFEDPSVPSGQQGQHEG